MLWLQVLLLAVVQGVTEFLPISSDGHLLVVAELLKAAGAPPLHSQLVVTIVLHLGTLLAVILYFHEPLWQCLTRDRALLGKLVVGTLPAIVVGYPLHESAALRPWLESPALAGCMLIVTGGILIWAARRPPGEQSYRAVTYGQALLIGAAQALAVLPGLSRSGTTIAAALGLGLKREDAATFSFLLSIPAVTGAVVLGLGDLSQTQLRPLIGPLVAGTAVSLLVGLFALHWLLAWLRGGRLHRFAYWCVPLGLALLLSAC